MPKIFLKAVGGSRTSLQVEENVTIDELRTLIDGRLGAAGWKLVYKGKCLEDTSSTLNFNEGDTILAMPQRITPPDHISRTANGEPGPTEEEDFKFHLPPNATPFQKSTAQFLQKHGVPDIFLIWLFSIKLKHWLMFIGWMVLSPVAARFEVGPLYILGTIFVLMMSNLGRRGAGEASAYSWFNEGFRQLPGQLNADAIDRQMRRGQM